MIYRLTRYTLAIATLCAAPAFAATTFGEYVTLTGFGTIGGVATNTDEAQFTADPRQGKGAKKSIDFGVDSKLGLQANANFNDTFSAVGQLLVSRRINQTAALEWLYGQAKLPAGFDIKVGRMVLPLFMLSDSRSVGYAAHWLRAPEEVYSQYTASSFDGGQLVYRNAIGPVNLTAQLSAGKAHGDIGSSSNPNRISDDNIKSVNVVLESGDWLVRFGQTTADVTSPFLPFPAIKDKFTGLGVQYDNGTAVVMAEYVTRRDGGVIAFDSDSWYVSAGWRVGNWTPYATVSHFTATGNAYGGVPSDSTQALGLRWNAMPNLALKAQVQNTKGLTTSFTNAAPAFAAGYPKVRVLSLVADFVF